MKYQYRMEPVAPLLEVNKRTDPAQQVSDYLSTIVNDFSRSGWEFFRLDNFQTYLPPGCLFALFGIPGKTRTHYVATIRKPIEKTE